LAEYLSVNGLEFFLSPCDCGQCADRIWALRDWGQFLRFYQAVSQITGSYTQAVQLSDPDVIDALCQIKVDDTPKPPPWWRFTDVVHRLTDIADQLIASRAQSADVKFYPRPVNPAAKERKSRILATQESAIDKARRANAARRALKDLIE
jgi:hypothetical protein